VILNTLRLADIRKRSGTIPLSFVAGVSDDGIVGNNLKASPFVVGPGSPRRA
jgi:hypothetical protein